MFKQSLTIFQGHKLNKSILNNLIGYNLKLTFKEKPDYHDYTRIFQEFLNIHPDNSKILLSSYPELTLNNTKFFLKDLKILGSREFEALNFKGPLITDFDNNLLGNDNRSIDRILHNYEHNSSLSNKFEHIKFQPVIESNFKGKLSEFNSYLNSQKLKTNNNGFNLIHPHAAEFADLF